MNVHGFATHERCPTCLGRGTNNRGALCPMCNGLGEVPKPPCMQLDVGPKRDSVRERPARR